MNNISINRVYFDHWKKKIHLWETIDGKRYKDVIDCPLEYYVEDRENKSEITDVYGRKVVKRSTFDRNAIKQLKEAGVFLCESDLPQDIKFLHKRYEKRDIKPNVKDFNIAYLDIEVESSDKEFPKATEAKYRINLITVKLSKNGQIYTFGLQPYTGESKINYFHCPTEEELLENFISFFHKAKVDIITGWNINGAGGFDIPYIINRCSNLAIESTLSPVGKYYFNERTQDWSIAAIAVLDYMQFFIDPKFVQKKYESYSLDSISKATIGKGKLQYEGSINNLYKDDWNKFVDYNVVDAILPEEIERKMRFIELAINLAHSSLIPLERIFSAVSVIEGQILTYLHANNMVMSDRKEGVAKDELEGAYVESQMGYYEDVISYDFESLYPNMMIHYNISPETLVMNPSNTEELIKTPLSDNHGIYYKKNIGFLTNIVEKNFKERKEFKSKKLQYDKEGNKELADFYDSQQSIRKVFLNSIYGVLSNQWFHYYNINTARSVTLSGQHLIKFMRDKINDYFQNHFHKNTKYFPVPLENPVSDIKNRIVNLDTDSLFITLQDVKRHIADDKPLLEWANQINLELLTPLFNKLLLNYFKQFRVESKILFKIEKICTQMIMFGNGGKIYANKIISDEGKVFKEPTLKVSGFASKRSSTPSFCRKYIDETLEYFFQNPKKQMMVEKIRSVKSDFLKSDIELISFNRGINDYKKYAIHDEEYYLKNGLKYEKKTPIHVRSSMVYNCFIANYNLPYQPIASGSKIKFIYVIQNNEFNTDVVGYIGKCPEEIKNKFKVNYDEQFQVSFLNTIQSIFNVMKWGKIDIDTEDISYMIEF